MEDQGLLIESLLKPMKVLSPPWIITPLTPCGVTNSPFPSYLKRGADLPGDHEAKAGRQS
jgi:hypothetical protein